MSSDSENQIIKGSYRGRCEPQDANLRILKFEKILAKHNNISKEERNRIIARRNTAVWALKRKNEEQLSHLHRVVLKEIQKQVSRA